MSFNNEPGGRRPPGTPLAHERIRGPPSRSVRFGPVSRDRQRELDVCRGGREGVGRIAGEGSWPFHGDLRPKRLAPLAPEPAIQGQGGVDCRACAKPDAEYLWTSDRRRLTALGEPHGLPVVVLLEPREHFAGPADLPAELAREQGRMLGRVERAVLAVRGIARVHIGRWGEGAEHLHWWFLGRPEGFGQLRSSFAEIWDEVLPPTPKDIWEDNLDRVVGALETQSPAAD